LCAELGIATIGYRDIQLLWRENAD
jgi:hypothetical protein